MARPTAQTASARNAIGMVLGTVATAAGSVTGLFEAAGASVGMLNKYVADASEKQLIKSDYDMATFEENLLTELATEEAKTNRELKTFFAEDPANETMWAAAHARITAAVTARRNPNAAQAA